MSDEKVLECHNLCKTIGKKEILKDITFSVNYGDILGFIGPNGAGKTTTIKLIVGMQKITSGKVRINGYDIKDNFENAIREVGAIIENPDLYMYLTGYQNLEFLFELYGKVDKNRIDEVVKLVGLERRINDKVSTYSLGMRQRLGIALSILHNPKLLILDEPTNGLDPEGIIEIRNLLKKLVADKKMAVFISSHNLFEIENCCNKICIIKNGKIIKNDTMERIKNELFQDIFTIEIDNSNKIKDKNNMKILSDTQIEINCKKEDIPNIIEQLRNDSILIYEIKRKEKKLEEAFLQEIGGNVIE